MNLTWHIIKKDLTRTGYILIVWAFTGLYLLAYRNLNLANGTMWDNLGIISIFTFSGLSLALIPAIVQEDGLTETNVFWRTRPIRPGRLLAAKLGLLLTMFVCLPFLGVIIRGLVLGGALSNWNEFFKGVFFISASVLVLAAIAATTKDMGRHFLCLILLVFATGITTSALERFAPTLAPKARWSVRESKMLVSAGFCVLVAATMLYNQYFTRRFAWRIVLPAVGVVGTALISVFWTWRFGS